MKSRQSIASFLQAAARLQREISAHKATNEFREKDGNFILYAVDTDIVASFTTPARNGPLKADGQGGFGFIFPNDRVNIEEQVGLTTVLAEYIFHDLEEQWPIFQLPAHIDETVAMYNMVANKAHSLTVPNQVELSTGQKFSDTTDRIFRDFFANTQNKPTENRNDDLIKKLAADILKQLSKETEPIRELSRYFHLQSTGCALSLQHGIDLFRADPNTLEIADALDGAFNRRGGEFTRFYELSNLWAIRLATEKNRTRNIGSDAKALAMLDIINQRLAPLGGRLILITGDRSLLHSARNNIPTGQHNEFDHAYFSRFSRKYLRHFHAFLSDSLLTHSSQQIDSWLSAFLGKWSGKSHFGSKELDKIATDLDYAIKVSKQTKINDVADISSEWTQFKKYSVDWLIAQQGRDGTNDFNQNIKDHLETIDNGTNSDEFITAFRKTVNSRKDDLWNRFVSELSLTGLEFLFILEEEPSRNSPDVRFDSLTNATKVFTNLISGSYRSEPDNFTRDLDKVKEDTGFHKDSGQNALGYLHNLIFSCAFAQDAKWPAALSLAQRAINIVENNPDIITENGTNISGREAYYVAARATRITAQSQIDIVKSRQLIEKAAIALQEDLKKGKPNQILGGRFDIESLAISLSAIYLEKFSPEQSDKATASDFKLHSLREISITLWNECSERASNDESFIRNSTLVNIAMNCIQVFSLESEIMLQSERNPLENTPSELKDWMDTIESCVEIDTNVGRPNAANQPVRKSFLINSYLIFGATVLGRKPQLYVNFTDDLIKNASVTLYDTNRYHWLRSLCETLQRI